MDVRQVYEQFDEPVTGVDCGVMCAPHNPAGVPFCCDICHAVPAAYRQEWTYLRRHTDLWHVWRGDECAQEVADDSKDLRGETPENMLLLACKGAAHCQRKFRALSCRQFPFFPFITSDFRFIGLAYDWAFEGSCWVIGNLGLVREAFCREFVQAFDRLFELWPEELEGYAVHSEKMREYFAHKRRRIPILHRRGGLYLLSPGSERMRKYQA